MMTTYYRPAANVTQVIPYSDWTPAERIALESAIAAWRVSAHPDAPFYLRAALKVQADAQACTLPEMPDTPDTMWAEPRC